MLVKFRLDGSLNSFVVNPLAPVQETLCLLQNDTTAHNPSAEPQKAASMYYMVKLHIRSGKQQKSIYTLYCFHAVLLSICSTRRELQRCL